jgi:CubicO group peptidase (beta-lactamase class C family)
MIRHLVALTACLSLPLSASAAAPKRATGTSARVHAAIADPAGLSGPGCAAGVFRNGRTGYTAVSGAADVATQRPINLDTQFYAASVSKHFTAVAVMQLVGEGRIRLSEDIRTYLPEMSSYERPVTVQMLVNHTAGIRDSLMLLILNGQVDWSAAPRADALRIVFKQKQTDFEPGTQYAYSNGGYLLLSEIVERVSKMPFDRYMAERVLRPLGMTRSYILSGARPSDPNLANGYAMQKGVARVSNDYPLYGGSGGLVTTVNDLAKWDHDIDSGRKVWTPALLKLMVEPGRLGDGTKVAVGNPGNYYASGLTVGANWFSHGGGANGFKTFFARNQKDRLGIAILCNRSDVEPDQYVDKIIAAIGAAPSAGQLQQETATTAPAAGSPRLNGRYRSENLDAVYQLEAKGDDVLEVTVLGPDGAVRNKVALKRNAEGLYKAGPLELRPDADRKGFKLTVVRVTMHFARES